jgi:hypothetical protein
MSQHQGRANVNGIRKDLFNRHDFGLEFRDDISNAGPDLVNSLMKCKSPG